MKKTYFLLLLSACLILAACQGSGVLGTPAGSTAAPRGTLATTSGAYPAPAGEQQQPATSVGDPWTAYPPAPGDEVMERGNFFVDAVSVKPGEIAGQFDLFVEGSLPTPCNQPRAVVQPPDAQQRIVIELYSLISPQVGCTQVVQPFSGKVAALSGLPAGVYSVIHEDQKVAEFTVP